MMKNRLKSNRAASNTIEFLIIIIVIFLIIGLIIDYNAWTINRSTAHNIAQQGARLVALYGGDGGTEIENKYGRNKATSCKGSRVECYIADNIKSTKSWLGSIKVKSIDCGPAKVAKIGDRTYCSITYDWSGIAGSPFMKSKGFRTTTVTATALSEVQYK